jgi:hypothetical protein
MRLLAQRIDGSLYLVGRRVAGVLEMREVPENGEAICQVHDIALNQRG